MSTDLHRRMLAFNYEDDDRAALMRKIWEPTPWMVDAYDGGYSPHRNHKIMQWCYDTFGEQAFPIHGLSGRWQRGSTTINGWTWFGFSTQAEMEQFIARWPTPEGVTIPADVAEAAG